MVAYGGSGYSHCGPVTRSQGFENGSTLPASEPGLPGYAVGKLDTVSGDLSNSESERFHLEWKASQTIPSWNQLVAWLRDMHLLQNTHAA